MPTLELFNQIETILYTVNQQSTGNSITTLEAVKYSIFQKILTYPLTDPRSERIETRGIETIHRNAQKVLETLKKEISSESVPPFDNIDR
jgi:hypothetical protein